MKKKKKKKKKKKISERIRAVWSESSLFTWRNFASMAIQNVPSEDSDQTVRMRRLIWIFAGCTYPKVSFLTLRSRYSLNCSCHSVHPLFDNIFPVFVDITLSIKSLCKQSDNRSPDQMEQNAQGDLRIWCSLSPWHSRDTILRDMVHFHGKQLCHNYIPPWEKVYLFKEEYAPKWSNLFPFRVDSFFFRKKKKSLVCRKANRK